jgi:hypothetical protein
MMKRLGVMAVHYGKEYLPWAVESLDVVVDEVHVFYSPTPSYGHADPALRCPETEDEVHAAANARTARPVVWHRVDGLTSESMHRSLMLELCRGHGATTMTVVDADEVWDPAALELAVTTVENVNRAGRWLARFHNFWRSWQWTVRDAFRPVRIVDLRHPITSDAYLTDDMQPLPVYHFGYAQSLPIMRYKFSCHGHKAEFKPGWYERVFEGWTPNGPHADLHPCVNNLWTAEPTDELTLAKVRWLLTDHPYAQREIIG